MSPTEPTPSSSHTTSTAGHKSETAGHIIERRDRFMMHNYPRYPIVMARGQGCHLYDTEGLEYLDLFAGFGAGLLGHCHPDLVRAVTEQANLLWHPGNLMHTEPQGQLAEAIAKNGFGGQSFFCHSGADANVAAIKLARLYGGESLKKRYKIITTHHSFHGRLFGAMEATGQPAVSAGYEPLLEGFSHAPYNDLDAMANAIDDETVAIMVEPIQGEGGMNIPDEGYLLGLRQLCNDHDLLLICDEVWTGCGRTGRYFAHQHWGVEPDVMTLAKGVGGGLPVAVVCAAPRVAKLFAWSPQHGVRHATTLGGNCLSMKVAATIFEVLERDGLVDRAVVLGRHLVDRLVRLQEKHPCITDVRGLGLFVGMQLDATADGAWFEQPKQVVDRCRELGAILHATKSGAMRVAPPLTITQEQLDRGVDIIDRALQSP